MADNVVYEIKKEKEGVKLVNYLKYELGLSTRLIRKLTSQDRVLINKNVQRKSYALKEGDVLELVIDAKETQDIEPEDIPIKVVYEDEDILVVSKPPDMVVHPTKGHPTGTLSNGIANYFKKTGQKCIVRLVNRLDMDTSGLIIVAKSQYAHQAMAKKLENKEIKKYYIAVVEGKLTGKGVIDLPVDRVSEDSIKREVVEKGPEAITRFKVLKTGENMSIVLIKLETGKTHQIRVHMSHMGYPLVGDKLYGKESPLINRQALHSYMLIFNGIRDNKKIKLISQIPDDMMRLIKMV